MSPSLSRLEVVPVTLRAANAFTVAHHRHHPAARGCRFCLGVTDTSGALRGVAIVGRPVARMLDDGRTAEVVRLTTDGHPNACSMLYGAARRAARAMGYRRIITYTLASEPGVSLRAAGWVRTAVTPERSWDRPSRPRADVSPTAPKVRWEAC